MKNIFILIITIILFSCQQTKTDSKINNQNKVPESDSVGVVKIIKGWGTSINTDELYKLQFTGPKDSVDLYSPIIGAGGTMYNKGNGTYEFGVSKEIDTATITILQKIFNSSTNDYLTNVHSILKIPVK